MSEIDDKPFPLAPLLGAGVLITMTIALAAGPKLGYLPPIATARPSAPRTMSPSSRPRSLRFTDRADGALVIDDAARGTTAAVLPHGVNNGFIRGVLRGIARDRKLRGVGPAAPFTLTLFADDALTLTTPRPAATSSSAASARPTSSRSPTCSCSTARCRAPRAAGKIDL